MRHGSFKKRRQRPASAKYQGFWRDQRQSREAAQKRNLENQKIVRRMQSQVTAQALEAARVFGREELKTALLNQIRLWARERSHQKITSREWAFGVHVLNQIFFDVLEENAFEPETAPKAPSFLSPTGFAFLTGFLAIMQKNLRFEFGKQQH